MAFFGGLPRLRGTAAGPLVALAVAVAAAWAFAAAVVLRKFAVVVSFSLPVSTVIVRARFFESVRLRVHLR